METPIGTINVTMTIPPQQYMAQAMEIMHEYEDVVAEALEDTKKDLIFNKAFKEEIKRLVKNQVGKAIEDGIKRAASKVVFDLYKDKDAEIDRIVADAILSVKRNQEEKGNIYLDK